MSLPATIKMISIWKFWNILLWSAFVSPSRQRVYGQLECSLGPFSSCECWGTVKVQWRLTGRGKNFNCKSAFGHLYSHNWCFVRIRVRLEYMYLQRFMAESIVFSFYADSADWVLLIEGVCVTNSSCQCSLRGCVYGRASAESHVAWYFSFSCLALLALLLISI